MIPLGAVLLLLQGIADLIRNIVTFVRPVPVEDRRGGDA
jgi:TRAP-type mannitol/chloroaromatic compound transport system permease small subunit